MKERYSSAVEKKRANCQYCRNQQDWGLVVGCVYNNKISINLQNTARTCIAFEATSKIPCVITDEEIQVDQYILTAHKTL